MMEEEICWVPKIITCKKCKRKFLEREKDKHHIKASLCSICNETLFTRLCMCFLKQD